MLLYYLEFLELGTGTCEASASSMLWEGDWDHIRDMILFKGKWLILNKKNFKEKYFEKCQGINNISFNFTIEKT